MKVDINPAIFRDYDIRGIYPKELNEETFYILGKSVATYLNVGEIAVGYDCRLSSPPLFKALTSGIIDQGVDVTDLGLISTEIHYFASGNYHFPADIIISASHNPAEYNGLKMVIKGVIPLHGEFGLPEIKKLTLEQNFSVTQKKGTVRKMEIMDEWIKHVLTFVNVSGLQPLKVVIDAGNGMGGISWQKLVGKIPVEIVPMYFEPDGHFPNHLPDPIKKENISAIRKAIIDNHADLGFAIDGDADRLFVLDDKGKTLSGTVTTAILAYWLLKRDGRHPILYNAVCGRIVPEIVKSLGGNPVRVRVGHSFIKQYMKKYQALFAGEHSGHFYFRDNYNAESSIIAGLLILEYLSFQNQSLSTLVKRINKYPQSGEINFRANDTVKISQSVEKKFVNADRIDKIDGLSIWFDDWWFNLRPSKTEPLFRLNLEADNQQILSDKLREVEDLLISLGCFKV